jgi:hypothetical protein
MPGLATWYTARPTRIWVPVALGILFGVMFESIALAATVGVAPTGSPSGLRAVVTDDVSAVQWDGMIEPGERVVLKVRVENTLREDAILTSSWDKAPSGLQMKPPAGQVEWSVPGNGSLVVDGPVVTWVMVTGANSMTLTGRLHVRWGQATQTVPLQVVVRPDLSMLTTIPDLNVAITGGVMPVGTVVVRAVAAAEVETPAHAMVRGIIKGVDVLGGYRSVTLWDGVKGFLRDELGDKLEDRLRDMTVSSLQASGAVVALPPYTLLLAGAQTSTAPKPLTGNFMLAAADDKTVPIGTPVLVRGRLVSFGDAEGGGSGSMVLQVTGSAVDARERPDDFKSVPLASAQLFEPDRIPAGTTLSVCGVVNQYRDTGSGLVMFIQCQRLRESYLEDPLLFKIRTWPTVPVLVPKGGPLPLPGSVVEAWGPVVTVRDPQASLDGISKTGAIQARTSPRILCGRTSQNPARGVEFIHAWPEQGVVLAIETPQPPESGEENFVIDPDALPPSVGLFRVGMTSAEIERAATRYGAAIGQPYDIGSEGGGNCFLQDVKDKSGRVLVTMGVGDRSREDAWRDPGARYCYIQVRDPRFHTANGVRVGMGIRELEARIGIGKFRIRDDYEPYCEFPSKPAMDVAFEDGVSHQEFRGTDLSGDVFAERPTRDLSARLVVRGLGFFDPRATGNEVRQAPVHIVDTPDIVPLTGRVVRRPTVDIQFGKEVPDTYICLVLDSPISVRGSADPAASIQDIKEMQLLSTDERIWRPGFGRFVDQRVRLSGTLMSASTAHHHTDVLVDVRTIAVER